MLKSLSLIVPMLALMAGDLAKAQGMAPAAMAGADDPALRSRSARPLITGPIVVDRIAATVNGRSITTNELALALLPIVQQLAASYPKQGMEFQRQVNKAKGQILDELIDRELLLGFADERGMVFPEPYVDQEVERTIRENYGSDREAFLKSMAAAGVTIRQFREITRKRLLVSNIRAMKFDMGIPPTPEEVRKEYEKSKSKYRDMSKDKIQFEKIFIAIGPPGTEDGNPEVQMELADILVDKLKKGELKFEDVARERSRDAYAEEGGKWPELTRDKLSAELGAIFFDAEENKIIGPLIDSNGFTIVRVTKKTLAPPPPLS